MPPYDFNSASFIPGSRPVSATPIVVGNATEPMGMTGVGATSATSGSTSGRYVPSRMVVPVWTTAAPGLTMSPVMMPVTPAAWRAPIRKGDRIYVEGRLQYRTYQDEEGKERGVCEIVASDVQFLGQRRKQNGLD